MATSAVYLLFLGVIFSVLPQCAFQELVTCRLGQTCVLPCRYEGQLNMVHWTRSPEDYNVHVYVDGRDELRAQYSLYNNRTSLSEDLSRGNSSLLLSQVSLQDQGRFRCFTSSSRGDHRSFLEVSVFAPVLQVSLEQEDEQLLCRSKGIYPEPVVIWTPSSAEANTTVSESEQGLFSVVSSVSLSDSENAYSCNILTEHSWKRAILFVKELPYFVYKVPSGLNGPFSCLYQTDTQSMIVRLRMKPINFWLAVMTLIGLVFMLITPFYDIIVSIKAKKRIHSLEKQLEERDALFNKIFSSYELVLKDQETAVQPDPQCLQKNPIEEQDRDKGSAPEDPHESLPVVKYSSASGQVMMEMHNSFEISEDGESIDHQNSELEELMSSHRDGESTGAENDADVASGQEDSRVSSDVHLWVEQD